MKHLLNGVAIAAVLAIAAPVWAQAPMTPLTAGPNPSGGASAPPAAAAPAAAPMAPAHHAQMHHAQMHHRPMRHHWAHKGKMMGAGDAMTEQLNREELARLQGGPPMPTPPTNAGAGQGGPRASGH